MRKVVITTVTQEEISDLDFALKALSSEMGDDHVATADTLREAFTKDSSAFNALLAYSSNEVVGALVWTAVFSTTKGGGGLYVSDLWVASTVRGQGIGNTLLSRALADANRSSGACFLKLEVHRANHSAFAYYSHLGFKEETGMSTMILVGKELQNLKQI